ELGEILGPLRLDIRTRRPQEGPRAPRSYSVLVQVLRIRTETNPGVVREQRLELRTQRLAQAPRARLPQHDRLGDELLAVEDRPDQLDDLGRRREPGRSRLPRLDDLASRKRQPPDDACFGRDARDQQPEPLQVVIEGVVVVLCQVLRRPRAVRQETFILCSPYRNHRVYT